MTGIRAHVSFVDRDIRRYFGNDTAELPPEIAGSGETRRARDPRALQNVSSDYLNNRSSALIKRRSTHRVIDFAKY
jgi:hypothetical protein